MLRMHSRLHVLTRKLPGRIQSDAYNACALRSIICGYRFSCTSNRAQVADEVGVVLKLAQKYGIAVTTRGAGQRPDQLSLYMADGYLI